MTIVLPWGRGVGKSWFFRFLCWVAVARWDGKHRPGAPMKGVRVLFLMPTLMQAKRVHRALMLDELSGPWDFLGGKVNKSDWRVDFPGGSWVQFVSAENAIAGKGLRCDLIIVDECDGIDDDLYDSMAVPWHSEPHSLKQTLLGGTPERGRYGLLARQFQRCKDNAPFHFGIHATYKDVPDYVDNAKVERDKQLMDPALFAREWGCDFDSAEGLVYPMFDQRIHVREWDNLTPFSAILVGVDHGYYDPGVFVVIGVMGSGDDARVHVLEEHYYTQRTEDFWIGMAKEVLGRYSRAHPRVPMLWYPDPSQPARIQQYKAAGCRVADVDNSIEDGISSVAKMVAVRERESGERWSRLSVTDKAKNTIAEFSKYKRKRVANTNEIKDQAEDKNNHAMDALRYALHNYFSRPAIRRDVRHLPAA